MKKSSEALSKFQDEAQVYRQKLESGEIRLIPVEKPSRPVRQKDETVPQPQR